MVVSADFEKAFSELKQNIEAAVQEIFPIEGQKKRLVLNGIEIKDDKDPADVNSQASAKFAEKTWGIPVYADLSLVDKSTGRVIDRGKVKIMTLPRITQRGSFIIKGKEYQFGYQFRLRPAAYARVGEAGNLEVQFNLGTGIGGKDGRPDPKGHRFRITFDPQTKKFALVDFHRKIGIYPLLRVLGVSDSEIRSAWGVEIWKANVSPIEETEKLFKAIFGRKPKDSQELQQKLTWAFHQAKLDSEVTAITLGKPVDTLTGETLLLATKKLLAVSRGEAKPDDRNSLQFKTVHGFEDFLPERLLKMRNNIKRAFKVDRATTVREAVHPTAMTKALLTEFTGQGHAEIPDQINPLHILTQNTTTTLMGPGGIVDEHQVEENAKLINPSHLGALDPIHTPESARTGVTLQKAIGAIKKGKRLYIKVYDIKKKKFREVPVNEIVESVVVLPDQVRWVDSNTPQFKDKTILASVAGNIERVPVSKVDYILPAPELLFSYASNLVPFLQNNHGNRAMMAVRQMEQAVPLKYREPPLIQVKAGTSTFEKEIGKWAAVTSPVTGVVTEIKVNDLEKEAYIKIRGEDGKVHKVALYHKFPLNADGAFLESEPIVKVGDRVTKGQVIADTNATKNGILSLGTNLRYAYIPYKGYSHDDGIVISESAAKKLTSVHLYRFSNAPGTRISKKYYYLLFPNKLTVDKANKLDPDGVIKEGETVKRGDILIAAYEVPDTRRPEVREMIRLNLKTGEAEDAAVVWNKNVEGKVIHVWKDKRTGRATVTVRTEEPAKVGDKIVARHANKGIITAILPDHEMPYTKDGRPVEVLFNPLGVPSRINAGQILETAYSKVAAKKGKPVAVRNFDPDVDDWTEKVQRELQQHGIKDKETLYDPKTKKPIGDVLVGYQYTLKQKHMVDAKGKFNVRAGGPGYKYSRLTMMPATGEGQSGQTMDYFGLYALLAHNARANIREMQTYKSDYDEDFWFALQNGDPIPAPKVPFVFDKFQSLLKGVGINVEKKGSTITLLPSTDKQIMELVKNTGGGEIKHPYAIVRASDLTARPGGLFDPQITGGVFGKSWSYIDLTERMPNPVFEKPIAALLGLKVSDIYNPNGNSLMTYDKKLNGKTGAEAIVEALSKINVEEEIKKTKEQVKHLKGPQRDKAVRKLRYLTALKRAGLSPVEAYTISKVPVLPPIMRPLIPSKDTLILDDLNYFYASLGVRTHRLKTADKAMPEEYKNMLRRSTYDALRALFLTGGKPSVQAHASAEKRGIIPMITGKLGGKGAAKYGYFQRYLIGKRQDLSMRATIVPEPDMDLDEITLPEDAAMELYKPFVIRRLRVQYGYSYADALKEVENNTETAKKALHEEVKYRPVLAKRDPALHKFSVMAFKPRLDPKTKAIKIHPLVTDGFNADFDGDQMSVYVPVSTEAVQEAYRMLPSKNLFSTTEIYADTGTGRLMNVPKQEALLGLYLLSRVNGKSDKKFKTVQEAVAAFGRGEIRPDVEITIGGKKTTIGRILVAQALKGYTNEEWMRKLEKDRQFAITKKELRRLLTDLAKNYKDKFPRAVNTLQKLGFAASYRMGVTLGLEDIKAQKDVRAPIEREAQRLEQQLSRMAGPREKKDAILVERLQKYVDVMDRQLKEKLTKNPNNLSMMVLSGAKGSFTQLRQMVAGPGLVRDATGRVVPRPILKSFSEGLPISDYWTALHGARKGMIQRAVGTALPGELTKSVLNATANIMVVEEDCGTHEGILMDINDPDILGRFTPKDQTVGGVRLPRNTKVTADLVKRLKSKGVQKLLVRSPLKCESPEGVCRKCVGEHPGFGMPELGMNVGVISAHSLGEPMTQLALDAFHTGGVVGARGTVALDRFTQVQQMLKVEKNFKNEATLATVSGKVSKIQKDPAGGWRVTIAGESQYVPQTLRLLVKEGDQVKKGEPISTGEINPRKLLDITGDVAKVQNVMTDSLLSVYGQAGVPLVRRNVETVVRAITNVAQVEDPGDAEDVFPGDILPYTKIKALNKNLKRPIIARPVVKGVEQLPLAVQEDWMAKLQHQRLEQTILESAAMGLPSHIHGLHPIPAMAYAKEFGKGTPEQPFLY